MTYFEYCELFASRCSACQGQKRTIVNGSKKICSCQKRATLKWRLEQIEVWPPDLKYKSWSDFTGIITNGTMVVGKLDISSAITARMRCLEYCFGNSSLESIEDRKNNLIVHKHLNSGKNIIIAGDRNSGKTLLACLILKEVAWACAIHNLDLGFKWITANALLDAARWNTTSKEIDYDYLEYLQSIQFLAIDGIDNYSAYGHTSPPDIITLNSFFGSRRISRYPLLLICSLQFLDNLARSSGLAEIKRGWGEDFLSLITDTNNIIVRLEKSS